ncbi:hypothetical protein GCM10023147_41460 [Tsukamurella soli]|uniref:Uncharacterized protein n=1 Tax=Tsukamurella soli TaxID=644556 RepID=A0ABP8K7G0_9ACTN
MVDAQFERATQDRDARGGVPTVALELHGAVTDPGYGPPGEIGLATRTRTAGRGGVIHGGAPVVVRYWGLSGGTSA